jgi:hypothetical protein
MMVNIKSQAPSIVVQCVSSFSGHKGPNVTPLAYLVINKRNGSYARGVEEQNTNIIYEKKHAHVLYYCKNASGELIPVLQNVHQKEEAQLQNCQSNAVLHCRSRIEYKRTTCLL